MIGNYRIFVYHEIIIMEYFLNYPKCLLDINFLIILNNLIYSYSIHFQIRFQFSLILFILRRYFNLFRMMLYRLWKLNIYYKIKFNLFFYKGKNISLYYFSVLLFSNFKFIFMIFNRLISSKFFLIRPTRQLIILIIIIRGI